METMEISESGGTPKPIRPETSSVDSEIYLFKLIESHCREIDSINNECKTKLPKLMSQRLPKFMRRRASSHNPKRIPASVRQSAIDKSNETKIKTKNKTNKKKYVNKKKQELSLKRRHKKNDRSVLHVWFAKRFQMKKYWNYLIPEKNNTKNQRILYHNSKKDFVFYFLSYETCIEMDYSKSERQELISFLAKFIDPEIGCTFAAKIFEFDNREGNHILFEYESHPFEPLVPIKFLWNQTFSKLWIWTHISIYERVLQTMTEISQKYNSNKFTINSLNKRLERFRVIGPNALNLLSRTLEFDFNQQINSETIADSVHYFRSKDNTISVIDSSETNIFNAQDFEDLSPKTIPKDFDFLLIIKNKTFNNRFAIDLIVSSASAKTLWHRMAENRSHRVGGLNDLRMIALNTSSLFFPFFGFIDVKDNESKLEKLKQILNLKDQKEIYVLRNDSLIRKLCQKMSSVVINELMSSIGERMVLINVDLNCIDRGVPQLFDYICLPTEEEIQNVFERKDNKKINDRTYESKSTENFAERKIIGLIEFGGYCLETSRGKGLGVVSITGLKDVIEINERVQRNNNYKNSKTIASFKSLKSCSYRMVIIKVMDSLFSV